MRPIWGFQEAHCLTSLGSQSQPRRLLQSSHLPCSLRTCEWEPSTQKSCWKADTRLGRSRSSKPNHKKADFVNRSATKGCFSAFGLFFPGRTKITKIGDFHESGGFREFSLFFFQDKHSEFTRAPFSRPVRESALFLVWFFTVFRPYPQYD